MRSLDISVDTSVGVEDGGAVREIVKTQVLGVVVRR
jgi:hypothetical protein